MYFFYFQSSPMFPLSPEQIAGRLSTSTKWEDMMTKWFSDIDVDVTKATHCRHLQAKNGTFSGEYPKLRQQFLASVKAAKGKGKLEGYSGEVPAETWVNVHLNLWWRPTTLFIILWVLICSESALFIESQVSNKKINHIIRFSYFKKLY